MTTLLECCLQRRGKWLQSCRVNQALGCIREIGGSLARLFTGTVVEFRQHYFFRTAIYGLAVLCYLFDREDVVWRILRWHTPAEILEAKVLYSAVALLAGLATLSTTYARLRSSTEESTAPPIGNPLFFCGETLFAFSVSFYLSTAGSILAISGILLLNLRVLTYSRLQSQSRLRPIALPAEPTPRRLISVVRGEVGHWGYLVMMIAFALTLSDSLAWTIGGCAFALSFLLNLVTLFPESCRDCFIRPRS